MLKHLDPQYHSQGMALIIAMFILMAITGLGIVAMQSASMEQQGSSNVMLDRQAYYTTEAALNVALAMVGNAGDGYWQAMQANAFSNHGSPSLTLSNETFQTLMFKRKVGDLAQLNPQVEVLLHDPIDGLQAPGFSDNFCFKQITFDAKGSVGHKPSDAHLNDRYIRYAVREFRAQGLLGPTECLGN